MSTCCKLSSNYKILWVENLMKKRIFRELSNATHLTRLPPPLLSPALPSPSLPSPPFHRLNIIFIYRQNLPAAISYWFSRTNHYWRRTSEIHPLKNLSLKMAIMNFLLWISKTKKPLKNLLLNYFINSILKLSSLTSLAICR